MIAPAIGPLTSLIEGAAAAVGAAMLLGGFAVGLQGVVLGWSRELFEARALQGGYVGGVGGVAAILADVLTRYIV